MASEIVLKLLMASGLFSIGYIYYSKRQEDPLEAFNSDLERSLPDIDSLNAVVNSSTDQKKEE